MPSYKDVSSSDSEDEYLDVDSSFNQSIEDIESEKRVVKNQNLSKRLTQVTEEFEGCKLNGSAIEYVDSEDEEVVEGQITGGAVKVSTNLSMPETDAERQAREAREAAARAAAQVTVDFEDENGQDGAKAIEYSRTLVMEFTATDKEEW